MPPGCNSEYSDQIDLKAGAQTTRNFGLCRRRAAGLARSRRWGNFLGRNDICEGDRDQATFGLDGALRPRARTKDAERVREPTTDSRSHHDASTGFDAEEKVDSTCAHRSEPIPRYISR